MSKNKEKFNKTRQEFLLSFFTLPHHYEVKNVNGFYLIRQFDADRNQWLVAIYTPDSYQKVLTWKQKQQATAAQEHLLT